MVDASARNCVNLDRSNVDRPPQLAVGTAVTQNARLMSYAIVKTNFYRCSIRQRFLLHQSLKHNWAGGGGIESLAQGSQVCAGAKILSLIQGEPKSHSPNIKVVISYQMEIRMCGDVLVFDQDGNYSFRPLFDSF